MSDTSDRTNKATFRFYEELNDFLPEEKRKQAVQYSFQGHPSVKDAIEAQGVPHVEVDLILVNDQSVDFQYQLKDSDRISVYPVFESLDISPIIRLRPEPLRESKFVLDVHLGKLARLLRLAGLDTLYRNDYKDEELVQISLRDRRIILTMDRCLLKRKAVTHGLWIRSRNPKDQLVEILKRLDLYDKLDPFSRCLQCNTLVQSVDKDSIKHRLQPRTLKEMETFTICPACDKIYWQGSHYDRMRERLKQWLKVVRNPD